MLRSGLGTQKSGAMLDPDSGEREVEEAVSGGVGVGCARGARGTQGLAGPDTSPCPGAHAAHAPVHRAAAGLPGRALGRHVHCGLPRLPLHPHPHGAAPHVPAQPHLHRPGNEVCKWLRRLSPEGSGGRRPPGEGRAGGPSLPLSRLVLQLDAAEAEPILDEREGVDEYNEMPMPV